MVVMVASTAPLYCPWTEAEAEAGIQRGSGSQEGERSSYIYAFCGRLTTLRCFSHPYLCSYCFQEEPQNLNQTSTSTYAFKKVAYSTTRVIFDASNIQNPLEYPDLKIVFDIVSVHNHMQYPDLKKKIVVDIVSGHRKAL